MSIPGELRHRRHPRHLLRLQTEPTEPYTCNGCGELGFGNQYTCKQPRCRFHLHKACALASPDGGAVAHEFFPRLKFGFLESQEDLFGRRCDACRRDVTGCHYHCDGEGWDLHPTCLNLPDTIGHPEVKDVVLRLRKKMSSDCFKCGKVKLDPGRGRSWAYVSAGGESIHVACAKDLLIEIWEVYRAAQRRRRDEEKAPRNRPIQQPPRRDFVSVSNSSPVRPPPPRGSPRRLSKPLVVLHREKKPLVVQPLQRPLRQPAVRPPRRPSPSSAVQPPARLPESQARRQTTPDAKKIEQGRPAGDQIRRTTASAPSRSSSTQTQRQITTRSTAEVAVIGRQKKRNTFMGFLKKAAMAVVKNADKIIPVIVALVVSVVTGNPIPLSVAVVGNLNLFGEK